MKPIDELRTEVALLFVHTDEIAAERIRRLVEEVGREKADLEEVLEDTRRFARELDQALYGKGAAKQASLVDLRAAIPRHVSALVVSARAAREHLHEDAAEAELSGLDGSEIERKAKALDRALEPFTDIPVRPTP